MAPPILSYENLGLVQGEGWLFRGIDVFIGPRDRLALIGRNGGERRSSARWRRSPTYCCLTSRPTISI